MKPFPKFSYLLALSLGIISYSCASRPDEEVRLAQEAMAEAKEQHAAEFATSDWDSAMEAWNQADAMLKQENYSQTRTILLRAKSRFEKARDIAKSKRDLLLSETQGLQKTIDIRYGALKGDTEKSSAKLAASRKQSLEDSFADIDKGIEKLKAEIEQGEYTAAKTTAQTTMRQVYETEVELQGYLGLRKKS